MYRPGGFYYFLTLTAPSDQDQHCKKAGCSDPHCSHQKCACTPPGGVDLGEWNPTAARRWNRLLLALERRYSARPAYFRAVEPQDGHRLAEGHSGRGALHLHVLIHTPRKWSLRTLRGLAIAAGFGHAVDLQPITPGSRSAARYVSKYVAKACDTRDDVPWAAEWVNPDTGEILEIDAPATFRTWSQSASWGKTLTSLKVADLERYRLQEAGRLALDQAPVVAAASPTPGPEPGD